MLVDRYDRLISYLRISVTDRCNLRCGYCRPVVEEHSHRDKLLTFEEIVPVATIASRIGLTKNPNSVHGAAGFGSIPTAGDPRVIQFGLKLNFSNRMDTT